MKIATRILPLLVLALAFSGCLDFTLRYIIHPDGTVRLACEIVMDSTALQFMGAMDEMSATTSGESAEKKSEHGLKTRRRISQSIVDSIKHGMMQGEYGALAGKSFVKSVDVQAFQSDSNLRIVALVDLTSYRYIDSAAKLAAEVKSSSHSDIGHSEVGHSGAEHAEAESSDTDAMEHHSVSMKLHSESGPTVIEQGDSVGFVDIVKDQSLSDLFGKVPLPNGDTTQIFSDSAKQDLSGMFSGLLGQIKSKVIVEAPDILSHDPSGIYDPVQHTVTWDIDLATSASSSAPPKRYVWFRKPGLGKQ